MDQPTRDDIHGSVIDMEQGLNILDAPGGPDTAVGAQLQNLRVFRGLSREDAAQHLNVTDGVIEDLESGFARPQPDLLLKMARIYGVPPSRVFDIAKVSHDPDQQAE